MTTGATLPFNLSSPRIRKASLLRGKRLTFRDATVAYAEFILAQRTTTTKALDIGATVVDLDAQSAWLKHYEDQSYFVLEADSNPVGAIRLYDAQGGGIVPMLIMTALLNKFLPSPCPDTANE